MDYPKFIELSDLKIVVDNFFGFDISTKKRDREFVYARVVYFVICRDLTKSKQISLSQIGKEVNRDHATVLYGFSVWDDHLHKDDYYLHAKETIWHTLTKMGEKLVSFKTIKDIHQAYKKIIADLINDHNKELEAVKNKYATDENVKLLSQLDLLNDEHKEIFIKTRLLPYLKMNQNARK